jgi:hypothetical protein
MSRGLAPGHVRFGRAAALHSRRMLARGVTVAAIVVLAFLGAAAGASAPESDLLVRHGQGIGKLRLGMTLPQVRSLLGAPRAENRRERRPRSYTYLELDWGYAWWTVGFERAPGGKYRAVSIGTVQSSQRTPEGLGAGSRERDLARRLPGLRCWRVRSIRDPYGKYTSECVYGERAGRNTAFILDGFAGLGDPRARVLQVEVRAPGFYRARPVRICPLPTDC